MELEQTLPVLLRIHMSKVYWHSDFSAQEYG